MRLRSVVAVVTAAAVALVVPGSGSASAAGSCSVVAPTKVVLDQPYRGVALRLAGDCAEAGMDWAAWEIVHPSRGLSDIVFFDASTVDYWDVYDWSEGPARYEVRPTGAWSTTPEALAQNAAFVTVKLGSRLSGTVTRASGRLTFDMYARTYSPALSGWYKRAYAKVSLMHRAPGSATWKWVKAATTNSAGKVRLAVVPKHGAYRLMIKETDRVWASYTSAVRGM
jgi:hypothetical protein